MPPQNIPTNIPPVTPPPFVPPIPPKPPVVAVVKKGFSFWKFLLWIIVIGMVASVVFVGFVGYSLWKKPLAVVSPFCRIMTSDIFGEWDLGTNPTKQRKQNYDSCICQVTYMIDAAKKGTMPDEMVKGMFQQAFTETDEMPCGDTGSIDSIDSMDLFNSTSTTEDSTSSAGDVHRPYRLFILHYERSSGHRGCRAISSAKDFARHARILWLCVS